MDTESEIEQIVKEEREWLRKMERLRQERHRREIAAYLERVQERRRQQKAEKINSAAYRDQQELKKMIQDVRVFRQYMGFAETEMKYEELLVLENLMAGLKDKIKAWLKLNQCGLKNN